MNKEFISTVIIVGLAYTLIVVLITIAIGKEVASVAAITLSTLATTIFSRFETFYLKVKPTSKMQNASLPKFDGWYFTLLCLGFVGIQLLAGSTIDVIYLKLLPHVLTDVFNMENLYSIRQIQLLFKIWATIVFLSISCLIGGIVCGKTARQLRYAYAAFAALCATGIQIALIIMHGSFYIIRTGYLVPYTGIFSISVFSLGYVLLSIIGVRIGLPRVYNQDKNS